MAAKQFLCTPFVAQELSCRKAKQAKLDLNRIQRTVAYTRPLKLQASLRGHNLVQKPELVDVGHRFGKVSVLAIMPGNFYLRKLERTSNADRLKLNNRSAKNNMNLIEEAIVAFVRSLLGNFCHTQKLQSVQHTRHSFRKLVGIRVTTHPCQRAVERSTPNIGISFERCSMMAW